MANPPVPQNLLTSKAMALVVSQGWSWREEGDQVVVENCVECKAGNYHLYFGTLGNKDGLWVCHKCGATGNLRTMREKLGIDIPGVDSRNAWAKVDKPADSLPDANACHTALLGDADALDYLLNTRGFSQEIINRQKLGLKEKHYFRECGEVRALVIPYLVGDNCVYAKFRTLPPSPKDFTSPSGYEAPLYNQQILVEGLEEIIFVEGEADALALMSHGVENVCGVPGANMKKAVWIEQLDKVAPKRIFILYDSDKVGTKAAQALASRIGYDKCLKLVLPPFTVTVPMEDCKLCDNHGVIQPEVGRVLVITDTTVTVNLTPINWCTHTRPGKDVNEWFTIGGGTAEEFEKLKQSASLFDVTGVTGAVDALDELQAEIEGKLGLGPAYKTPWPKLSELVGWENGDVIDIVAPEKIGKTTFGLNIMEFEVDTYGEDGLVICLEMTPARLARKWVCMVTGTDDSQGKTVEEEIAKKDTLLKAIDTARGRAAGRTGDLYFSYPQVKEPEDVYKLIRDCIRRYGVKWVMFDNIQLLCDNTLKNHAHRTVHLSQISKQFAKLAKDYGIKLIRILQPKRIAPGNIVSTDDVDGSSQIAKDCDCMITLHRARIGEIKKADFEMSGVMETKASFDDKMLTTVGLSRYSCGGSCTLLFKGATSQVLDMDEARRAAVIASRPSTNGYEMPTEVVIPVTQRGEIAI